MYTILLAADSLPEGDAMRRFSAFYESLPHVQHIKYAVNDERRVNFSAHTILSGRFFMKIAETRVSPLCIATARKSFDLSDFT